MTDALGWFQSGGALMWGMTLFALGVLGFLIVGVVSALGRRGRRAQAMGWLAAIGAAMIVGAGALGYVRGVQIVHEANARASPESRSTLVAFGAARGSANLSFGGALGGVLLLASLGLVAWGVSVGEPASVLSKELR